MPHDSLIHLDLLPSSIVCQINSLIGGNLLLRGACNEIIAIAVYNDENPLLHKLNSHESTCEQFYKPS